MKIRLLDWSGEEHFVEIPDETEEIFGVILSGDMVLISPFFYDTSTDRIHDYYDGHFKVSRKDLHLLDKIFRSYEVFDLGE